jgi:hypothetical protein
MERSYDVSKYGTALILQFIRFNHYMAEFVQNFAQEVFNIHNNRHKFERRISYSLDKFLQHLFVSLITESGVKFCEHENEQVDIKIWELRD